MVLFTYLYRDASNCKAREDIILVGELTSDLEARLRRCLIDGEYFIPEKVGLPSLRERLYQYSDEAPTSADHLLHELVELRPATAEECVAASSTMPIESLVQQFEATARAGWWNGAERLVEELGLDL